MFTSVVVFSLSIHFFLTMLITSTKIFFLNILNYLSFGPLLCDLKWLSWQKTDTGTSSGELNQFSSYRSLSMYCSLLGLRDPEDSYLRGLRSCYCSSLLGCTAARKAHTSKQVTLIMGLQKDPSIFSVILKEPRLEGLPGEEGGHQEESLCEVGQSVEVRMDLG